MSLGVDWFTLMEMLFFRVDGAGVAILLGFVEVSLLSDERANVDANESATGLQNHIGILN